LLLWHSSISNALFLVKKRGVGARHSSACASIFIQRYDTTIFHFPGILLISFFLFSHFFLFSSLLSFIVCLKNNLILLFHTRKHIFPRFFVTHDQKKIQRMFYQSSTIYACVHVRACVCACVTTFMSACVSVLSEKLIENVVERFRILRTGKSGLAVENEERHASSNVPRILANRFLYPL